MNGEDLLKKAVEAIADATEFEELLQIGSGALRFLNFYSDIDLMFIKHYRELLPHRLGKCRLCL